MAQREELWKLAIRACGELINVGNVHPSDEKLLAATFLELYLVGERPSLPEVETFLKELWPAQPEYNRRAILEIWRKLIRNPQHRFRVLRRNWPWRQPFYVLDGICQREGLEPVGERLARQVGVGAENYRKAVEAAPAAPETEGAARALAMTVRALEVWGSTRDADPDAPWGASVLWLDKQSDPVQRLARFTKTGRARHEEWLQRVRDEHERRFPTGRGGSSS